MLQNKVTRSLLFVLVFVMVLNVGLLVGDKVVNKNQLASVASSGENNRGEGGGEDMEIKCKANPQKASVFTKWDQFGDGSVVNPYEIWTAAQLSDMQNGGLNKFEYLQCANIDLSLQPQFVIEHLMGHYNGNYFSINGYHYEDLNSTGNFFLGGLFLWVTGGTIDHVRLSNTYVKIIGANSIAAPLAMYVDGSKINDIKTSNTTSIATSRATGLIFSADNSEITNIEINNVTAEANNGAAGFAYNVRLPGVLKNIKVSGGNMKTVFSIPGSAGVVAGVENAGSSGPTSDAVFENMYFKGQLTGMASGGIAVSVTGTKLKNATVESTTINSLVTNYNADPGIVHFNNGGVVSILFNSALEKAKFTGSISKKNILGCVSDRTTFGGLVGYSYNSSITWSSAEGRINVENNCGPTGGLLGKSIGSLVQNSFANGSITFKGADNADAGGFMGLVVNVDSTPSLINNYSNVQFLAEANAKVSVLGGHFGRVIASGLSDQWNFTSPGNFPVIATEAGPFVGKFISSGGGIPPLPFTHYYNSAISCSVVGSGSCNNIGTPTPLVKLLNVTLNPLAQWTFAGDKWVQSPIGTLPTIPTAGYQ